MRQSHGCTSFVSVVWCQVEDPTSGWSLIQGSNADCDVAEYDRESSTMKRSWPAKGCRNVEKLYPEENEL